jgi:succinyl-CoA synthetase beta subunit
MDIHGFTVHEVYVEEASDIAEEYYAAIVFDRSAKQPMAMLSRMGGMDVEEVAEKDPEAMRMLHVDPLIGFPWSPRRAAGRPTSWTPAAARRPKRSRARWR